MFFRSPVGKVVSLFVHDAFHARNRIQIAVNNLKSSDGSNVEKYYEEIETQLKKLKDLEDKMYTELKQNYLNENSSNI